MRRFPSDFATADQGDYADESDGPASIEHPHSLSGLDVALDTHIEHEDGDDPRSDGQLNHQDPVNPADEVPPDGLVSKSSAEASRGVPFILFESTLYVIPVDCSLLLLL